MIVERAAARDHQPHLEQLDLDDEGGVRRDVARALRADAVLRRHLHAAQAAHPHVAEPLLERRQDLVDAQDELALPGIDLLALAICAVFVPQPRDVADANVSLRRGWRLSPVPIRTSSTVKNTRSDGDRLASHPASPASASASAPAVPIRLQILDSMHLTFPPIIAFLDMYRTDWMAGRGSCCILYCMSCDAHASIRGPRQRRRIDEIADGRGGISRRYWRRRSDFLHRAGPGRLDALASTLGAAPPGRSGRPRPGREGAGATGVGAPVAPARSVEDQSTQPRRTGAPACPRVAAHQVGGRRAVVVVPVQLPAVFDQDLDDRRVAQPRRVVQRGVAADRSRARTHRARGRAGRPRASGARRPRPAAAPRRRRCPCRGGCSTGSSTPPPPPPSAA